jgi:hypothetical protein
MLTADPSISAGLTADLMAQQRTLQGMAAFGAMGLGVIVHALRQPREPEDQWGRRMLGAYLRTWWDYSARAQVAAHAGLMKALAPTARFETDPDGLSVKMRAGVFEAFAELALVVCTASPDWIARLRLCEGPRCRVLYFQAADPGATAKTCSDACKQAAFRVRPQ